MKIFTIPQKMCNSGSIHDIASDMFDRDIVFRSGCKFAVVLSSYYGGKGYTTHRSEAATIAASRKNRGYSHVIIDTNGAEYAINHDRLEIVQSAHNGDHDHLKGGTMSNKIGRWNEATADIANEIADALAEQYERLDPESVWSAGDLIEDQEDEDREQYAHLTDEGWVHRHDAGYTGHYHEDDGSINVGAYYGPGMGHSVESWDTVEQAATELERLRTKTDGSGTD